VVGKKGVYQLCGKAGGQCPIRGRGEGIGIVKVSSKDGRWKYVSGRLKNGPFKGKLLECTNVNGILQTALCRSYGWGRSR
jgi:hypothetical protein